MGVVAFVVVFETSRRTSARVEVADKAARRGRLEAVTVPHPLYMCTQSPLLVST